MIEAIIGTVGIIVGTILGYYLSEKGAKDREERNEKRQAQSARTIVRWEIDRNLELLRESMREADQIPKSNESPERRKEKLARRFAELPLPSNKREGLDSQLSFLPIALSEQEIEQVFQFYDRLGQVGAIRSELAMAAKEHREGQRQVFDPTQLSQAAARSALDSLFSLKASSLWDEWDNLASRLLAEGNPLKRNAEGR